MIFFLPRLKVSRHPNLPRHRSSYAQFCPAAPTLLQAAFSSAIDLFVMCSHGSTGMIHALMGSVAQRVSQHATVPVFILRERGPVPAGPHPDVLQPLRALVGLDGSDSAKGAILPTVALISALAAPAQGALHLLHLIKSSDHDHLDQPQREQVIEHAKDSLRKTVEQICEEAKTASLTGLEPQLTWSVALGSDVAETLIRVAESGEEGSGMLGRCDIIALSTHGHGDLSRWAMGSVTERVLGATKLAMLIVRPLQMKTSAPRHLDGLAPRAIS
jgi:nucleotide-binding universal stress UspA family protein